MGRSGGPGGGGGHGGGGFSGGGRGGGSFSGGGGGGRSGGRSGGFGGGSPRGGGFGGGMGAGPRGGGRGGMGGGFGGFPMGGFNVGPSINVGGGPRGASGGGCGGCVGSIIGFVLVAMLLLVLSTAMGSCSGGGYGGYNNSSYSSSSYSTTSETSSDTVRTKLSGVVSKTAYYTDEDGDWVHTASKLEKGLSHFYDKTGVQPYVYILKNGSVTSTSELETLAEKYYDQLFSDEGHFLLVFCDTGSGTFNAAYWYGTQARTVMDDEAIEVLKNQLSNSYNTADSDEEVFSDAFYNTADVIMKAAEKQESTGNLLKVGGVAVAVAVVGGIAYVVVKNKKKADEERKKRADEILNTPLEKFSDTDKDVENLASKYEDKSGDA